MMTMIAMVMFGSMVIVRLCENFDRRGDVVEVWSRMVRSRMDVRDGSDGFVQGQESGDRFYTTLEAWMARIRVPCCLVRAECSGLG